MKQLLRVLWLAVRGKAIILEEPAMRDGYPNEALLDRIRTWPMAAGWDNLLQLVRDSWDYPDAFSIKHTQRGVCWAECATGGWSGNEELIGALRQNLMFWACCWESSSRGGGHTFKTPERTEP